MEDSKIDSQGESSLCYLFELRDTTLEEILLSLIQHCNPPQWNFPYDKGTPPPWWPKGEEKWLNQLEFAKHLGPPPYMKPYELSKQWKVIILVAVVKNLAYDFGKIRRLICEKSLLKERMTSKETFIWSSFLMQEEEASEEQLEVEGYIIDPRLLYFNHNDNYYDVPKMDMNVVPQKRKRPFSDDTVSTIDNFNNPYQDCSIGIKDCPPPLELNKLSNSLHQDDGVFSDWDFRASIDVPEDDSNLISLYMSSLENKKSRTSVAENTPTFPLGNPGKEIQQEVGSSGSTRLPHFQSDLPSIDNMDSGSELGGVDATLDHAMEPRTNQDFSS